MTSRVLVFLRVAATPERAFGAFVDDIGAWWRPNGLFCFTARSAGVLASEPREDLMTGLAGRADQPHGGGVT